MASGASASSSHNSACQGTTATASSSAPRSWTQPCRAGEHGIADGEWDLLFAGRQRLGHEERIACGLAIELLGVDAVRRSQFRHGCLRKWLELQPHDRAGGAELTEHDAQLVREQLIVSVGDDDERRNGLQTAPDEPKDVERGLVRPVDVLEDDDRRRQVRQLARQAECDLVRFGSARNELGELPACGLSDVGERPERARGEERVARAPQDSGVAARLLAKAA